MSPNLVLGPLLRYAGARDATVWVETDAACEVEVLVEGSSHRSHTFEVEGHHYTLIRSTGLKPGSSHYGFDRICRTHASEVFQSS